MVDPDLARQRPRLAAKEPRYPAINLLDIEPVGVYCVPTQHGVPFWVVASTSSCTSRGACWELEAHATSPENGRWEGTPAHCLRESRCSTIPNTRVWGVPVGRAGGDRHVLSRGAAVEVKRAKKRAGGCPLYQCGAAARTKMVCQCRHEQANSQHRRPKFVIGFTTAAPLVELSFCPLPSPYEVSLWGPRCRWQALAGRRERLVPRRERHAICPGPGIC